MCVSYKASPSPTTLEIKECVAIERMRLSGPPTATTALLGTAIRLAALVLRLATCSQNGQRLPNMMPNNLKLARKRSGNSVLSDAPGIEPCCARRFKSLRILCPSCPFSFCLSGRVETRSAAAICPIKHSARNLLRLGELAPRSNLNGRSSETPFRSRAMCIAAYRQ